MVRCPLVTPGDYMVSIQHSKIRCVAYTDPPSIGGAKIATIPQGTYLGPIEKIEFCCGFLTVQVQGFWVNIWAANMRPAPIRGEMNGINYAKVIPRAEAQRWERAGLNSYHFDTKW